MRLGSSLSPPSLDSITPCVAIEQGFFKRQGLDASINMGATEGIVSAAKGAKIKAWVAPQPVTPYHFVARKQVTSTLAGLVGKNIAVSEVGAISYHIPRIVLQRSGLDPDQAQYVAVGSPADRFKALVVGKVDATMVTNLQAAKLEKYPEIVNLLHVSTIAPEIP